MMDERQYSPEGFLIVGECDRCPQWEPHPTSSPWLCKECWFCKWADFRADITVHRHTSVCHNEINKLPETEELKL